LPHAAAAPVFLYWQFMHALFAAILAAAAWASPPAAVPFHFELIRSTPGAGVTVKTSPKRLQLWFTQVPAAGVSRITLMRDQDDVGAAAKTVIVPAEKSMYVELVSPLGAGAYVIAWRGAGDDGHVQTGTIPFFVKPPSR
jgi:methionine-rich copper-binding protein CopC